MEYRTRIREIRKALRLNQKEMAELLGFSQSYFCCIEQGSKIPNGRFIMSLSSKLGISMTWLANGIGEMFAWEGFGLQEKICDSQQSYSSPKELLAMFSQISSGQLACFTVTEDNMQPLYRTGDKILIDTSDVFPDDNGIYLFSIDSQKTLKRCIKADGIKLTNESPSIKNNDILYNSSMECLGRVVWLIRKTDGRQY